MAIGKSFIELYGKIGYEFCDPTVLENALTHSSYSNEYRSRGLTLPSNERLEFLGDAVLELVISEYLYDNNKKYSEGKSRKNDKNVKNCLLALFFVLKNKTKVMITKKGDSRTAPSKIEKETTDVKSARISRAN